MGGVPVRKEDVLPDPPTGMRRRDGSWSDTVGHYMEAIYWKKKELQEKKPEA